MRFKVILISTFVPYVSSTRLCNMCSNTINTYCMISLSYNHNPKIGFKKTSFCSLKLDLQTQMHHTKSECWRQATWCERKNAKEKKTSQNGRRRHRNAEARKVPHNKLEKGEWKIHLTLWMKSTFFVCKWNDTITCFL